MPLIFSVIKSSRYSGKFRGVLPFFSMPIILHSFANLHNRECHIVNFFSVTKPKNCRTRDNGVGTGSGTMFNCFRADSTIHTNVELRICRA